MKLSDPMRKALRYTLYVEMYGSMTHQTWNEFGSYSPHGRTLDALVNRGLLTELMKDANGFVVDGGEHKLTRLGYIELAYNYSDKKEESSFAHKRLAEIDKASEPTQARLKTQDEVREDRAQDGATLGEVDTIVGLLLSRVLGIPSEQIAQVMGEIKIVPIDPTILGIAKPEPEDPPFIRNLEALANGDPSAPDSTDLSRRAMEIARDLCRAHGVDSRFLIHAHEFPSGIQICTRFVSFVAGVKPLCDMIGFKIAEDFGWTDAKGGFTTDDQDNVAIVVAR